MSEPEFRPDYVSAMDQAKAALPDIGVMLARFFKALQDEGMDRDAALFLTVEALHSLTGGSDAGDED